MCPALPPGGAQRGELRPGATDSQRGHTWGRASPQRSNRPAATETDRAACRYRRYGTKCSGCGHGISPQDLVRKARDKVFHLKCFTCLVCRKQLSTGEELYVLDENRFICKEDYISGKSMPGESSASASASARVGVGGAEG